MMMPGFDVDMIRKTINTLKPHNQLFEVRIIKGKTVISGYFRDSEKLIHCLSGTDLQAANVYMTVQKLHEGCEARLQYERFIDVGRDKLPTTSDNDVIGYSYIPIDLDPVRPTGISSTKEELQAAFEIRQQIIEYMLDQDFANPIRGFSGNGYHLLFPIDWRGNKEPAERVRKILEYLDREFSNDKCHVDTTTFNPSRVLKLYGTYARKGRNIESRPHRLSKLMEN